jgi:hypothetical protein
MSTQPSLLAAVDGERIVTVGRDAERLALPHAVQWHRERRVLLNGHRRRLPLSYANAATRFASIPLAGRGSQPAGGSPQPP